LNVRLLDVFWNEWWHHTPLLKAFKVKGLVKAVIPDVLTPVDQVAISLRQIVGRQMLNQTLSVGWETIVKRDLLPQRHLEYLVSVCVHERWPTYEHFVYEDAQSVPVGSR